MKTILIAAILALPLLSQAQQPTEFTPFPDNGIYLTATDFTHHVLTDAFNTGQPGYKIQDETLRQAVKVKQPTTGVSVIPDSQLWGQRINDVDYRIVDGELYRVEHADRIFVYSKLSTINLLPQPVYYFSREADSPLYAITTENLANVYYDQPEKVKLFGVIDTQSGHSVQQAITLTKLFYPENQPNRSTPSAD